MMASLHSISDSDFTTPPSTPTHRAPLGLGFDFAIRSASSSVSSVALRSHWSSDSSLDNSPSSSSPPSSAASCSSPPLVPFSTFDETEEYEEDGSASRFSPWSLPSYSSSIPSQTPQTGLLPSASISECQFPPFYHDGMQQTFTPPASPKQLVKDACRKRKISASPLEPSSPVSRSAKRFRASPALQNLSLFTRAAMVENEERRMYEQSAMDSLSSMVIDAPARREMDAMDLPCKRRMDFTVLISDLPSGSPYPPTPGSTSLPPLVFSSSLPTSRKFPFVPYSPSYGQEIKADVGRRLGLAGLGISLDDVNVYPSRSGSCSSQASQHCTVVLHTAATA